MKKKCFSIVLAVLFVSVTAQCALISHYEFQGDMLNSIVGGGDATAVSGAAVVCPDPNDAPYPLDWPTICRADVSGNKWMHVGYPGVLYNIASNQKLTMAMWIRSKDPSYAQLFGRRYEWRMYIQEGKAALGILAADTSSVALVGNEVVTNGKWTHVAATYDGATGEAVVYVNGVVDNTITQTEPLVQIESTLRVGIAGIAGSTSSASNIFNGEMDDIRIYDEVLTAAQIYDIYYFTDQSEFCISQPAMDFTGDCIVDIEDMKIFIAGWLESGLIE